MSTILPEPTSAPADVRDRGETTLAGDPGVGGRTAVSDALLLTGGTYVAQALALVAGLVQRALLGPVGAGYWALMQTFWTFFSIAPLGAQQGTTRQIPLHRGRGDFKTAAAVAGTGASFSLTMISFTGLVVAAVAIVAGRDWDPRMRFGLVLLGVTAPFRLLSDLHETIIQSVKRFDVAALTLIVRAACVLVLQSLAIYLLGFYGVFAGLVVTEMIVFALWFRLGVISRARPAFRPRLDRSRLRELIRFGAPLLVYAQISLLFAAVDSLIVAGALNVKQLGYYALAVSVTHYVLYLPKSISGVLFPRMTERFAQTGEIASIHHYASDVQRALALALVPAAVAAGFFGFPVLIRHALPDFRPAIGVVEIMIAASFLAALMTMPIKVLITAGERWNLTGLMLFSLAVNAGLNYTAVAILDEGIEGAAVATAASYLVALMLTSGYGLGKVLPPRRVLAHLLELIAAFAYTFGALQLVGSLIPLPERGLVEDAAVAAVQLLAFFVAFTPALIYAERRTRIVSQIGALVTTRLRKS